MEESTLTPRDEKENALLYVRILFKNEALTKMKKNQRQNY